MREEWARFRLMKKIENVNVVCEFDFRVRLKTYPERNAFKCLSYWLPWAWLELRGTTQAAARGSARPPQNPSGKLRAFAHMLHRATRASQL